MGARAEIAIHKCSCFARGSRVGLPSDVWRRIIRTALPLQSFGFEEGPKLRVSSLGLIGELLKQNCDMEQHREKNQLLELFLAPTEQTWISPCHLL